MRTAEEWLALDDLPTAQALIAAAMAAERSKK